MEQLRQLLRQGKQLLPTAAVTEGQTFVQIQLNFPIKSLARPKDPTLLSTTEMGLVVTSIRYPRVVVMVVHPPYLRDDIPRRQLPS